MTPRYCALLDTPSFAAGAGQVVLYDPIGQRAHRLDQRRIALLSNCRGLATLAEHAATAAGPDADAGRIETIRAALADLARDGLLTSEATLLERVDAAESSSQPAHLDTVCIPTRGRGPQLERLLQSLLSARQGEPLTLVVADGAIDAAEAAPTRAALDRAGNDARAVYLGRDAKRELVHALAKRSGVDADLIGYAIMGDDTNVMAAGANRNALLLACAGDAFASLDDDTVCRVVACPDALDRGVALSAHGDGMEVWFDDPKEPWTAAIDRADGADPLRLHSPVLGASTVALLQRHRGALDLAQTSGLMLRRALASASRIAVTHLGIVGDTGMGSHAHYLMLAGPTRARLLASEQTYQRAFTTRQALRQPRKLTLGTGEHCMGAVLALDARQLLPPFMPSGRNEDGVFGALLDRCFAHSFIAYLPHAVAHLPHDRKSSLDIAMEGLRRIDKNDLLRRLMALSAVGARHDDPADDLCAMGGHLRSLGTTPLPQLQETMRVAVLRTRAGDLAGLRHCLASQGPGPEFWARDVERMIMALDEATFDPQQAEPADLVQAVGDQAGEAFRRDLRRFGDLLCAWPALFDAARELNAKG